MFNFSMGEIMIFGVFALVAIGPKDLPVVMKAVAGFIKKARGMASEFQGHVDDMMRDADLGEMRQHLREIRNFDIKSQVNRFVDPGNELGEVMAGIHVPEYPEPVITRPPEVDVPEPAFESEPAPAAVIEAPAFVPPFYVPKPAPAFIPPAHAARRAFH